MAHIAIGETKELNVMQLYKEKPNKIRFFLFIIANKYQKDWNQI